MEIKIERVEKDFGDYPALRDVNLTIARGELVALLGPSGSGKTTLLRAIAGLSSPDRGRILFDSEDATTLSVQERRVGFVFQNYALFKHLTVADNIAYGLKVRPRRSRPSRAEIAARAAELLEFVQLDGLGGRYPAQLSGGQRQRVALARALAIEPRVLLLDEPFGALDARVRKDLRRWLRDVHRQTGLTTVFVTHDQDEAMELADRVVVLDKGHIEQIGTPDELYDRPASPFVLSFVGEALALPVQVADGKVIFQGKELHVSSENLRNGPARVYFRPADIALHGGQIGALEGRVEAVRRTAAGLRASISIPGYDQTVEVDTDDRAGATLGSSVPLSLNNVRIFSTAAEETLGDGAGI
ncbi:sulfate/molybdate ABC transporter ATP-binding protein [Methylosinus sp. PW1]|uniref:sulfate/molybdate ABC transporter ATP-binding protein n=1 Tax=Methylosinus sp. PW1 TaxID=107636 RepID=UPI000562440B|nr:sulfate/molybdate ABC transporter ATP-binding protein [Methylosinus sp. PW1]